MSNVKHTLAQILLQPGGIVQLFQRAASDARLARELDDLDDVSLDDAFAELSAIGDDVDDDEREVQLTAEGIRDDVRLLFADASASEMALVPRIDPLVLDGALEAVSNVFRRTGSERVGWTAAQDVVIDDVVVQRRYDVSLEVARYVGLWSEAAPTEPAPEVHQTVHWAWTTALRVPELFRHVRAIEVQPAIVWLAPQPRNLWGKSRRERWMVRHARSHTLEGPRNGTPPTVVAPSASATPHFHAKERW
ncbi:MAG TPA: hypothetical protein VMG12_16580 [Polyangiaceae bacterium]|nr:hypothetical protein [Polyangiaceae bacterium]